MSRHPVAHRAHRRMPAAMLGVLALLAGTFTLAPAAPAQAHAVLMTSAPEDGSTIAQPPMEVIFVFDEPVRLADDATAVLADDGRRIDGTPSTSDGGTTVHVPLRNATRGAYTASFRIASADGHVVAGAIRFGIGVAPTIAATPVQPDSLSYLQDVAQGLVYLGLVLLLGIGTVTATIWRFAESARRVRGLRIAGWTLLLLGTLARLAIAGPLATGTGPSGILTLAGLDITLTGVSGTAGLARLALLIALMPWALRPNFGGAVGRAAAGVLAAGILVTVAFDGHAAVGPDAPVALLAAVGHLAAMSIWGGGLLVLLFAVLPGTAWPLADASTLRRWSMVAFAAVVVLIVTGEYQAWRQLEPFDSLVTTAYGITLLLKTSLVALAAAVAWLGHRRLGRAPSATVRRRTVVVEACILTGVLVLTTLLVALPPARTAYGPPVELRAPVAAGTAVVRIDTTHTGVQELDVTLQDAGTASVRALSGTLASDAVAGIPIDFVRQPDGAWMSRVVVPMAGEWRLQLDVDLGTAGHYATATRYTVW